MTLAKVLLVYESKYGNTKLVAEAIIEGIKEASDNQAAIYELKEIVLKQPPDFDAVLIGLPNHTGGPTGGIKKFINEVGKLWGIICWDCKLANDEEVLDIVGEKRSMKITSKDYSAPGSYKRYMLVSNTSPHNIEVFVLKDYLKDKLNLDFRPRGV